MTTTTTLNYQVGQIENKNTQFATNATENVVIVQVTPGYAVTVQFMNNQDWKYRSTTADATTDAPYTAGTPVRLRFEVTTTFYTVRTSADGTMVATPLLQEGP